MLDLLRHTKRRVVKWIQQTIKESLCLHWRQEVLIFGPPPTTHHEIHRCIKCGKSTTLWKGTRVGWYKRINNTLDNLEKR